jgi:sigma-B regulation protein RsbU (phosphoserine phosphatase)
VLGMVEGCEFPESERTIEPGSRLFLYSDGAHEIVQANGDLWNYPEFLDYFAEISHTEDPPQALLHHVRALHGGDQLDDDFTVLYICL